jgi:hypothetical protein|tara:strand:- start:252 stop:401 length:150 start_codon:yes stop_codon:yes gene_type:complete
MDIDIEEEKIEIKTDDIKLSVKGRISEKWILIAVSLILSVFGLNEFQNL